MNERRVATARHSNRSKRAPGTLCGFKWKLMCNPVTYQTSESKVVVKCIDNRKSLLKKSKHDGEVDVRVSNVVTESTWSGIIGKEDKAWRTKVVKLKKDCLQRNKRREQKKKSNANAFKAWQRVCVCVMKKLKSYTNTFVPYAKHCAEKNFI